MNEKAIRLLLVEDDKVDQMAFERFVKNENLPYDYTIAGSVAEAREILKSTSFDVIIADYMLGDGTSFELFDLFKGLPVIVLTGTGNEEVAVEAMKLGAYDYLIKDPEGNYLKTLPLTVGLALKRKQTEKELRRYQESLESIVKERTAQLDAEIIERKHAEEAMKLERDNLHNIFDSIEDGIYIVNQQCDIHYVNPVLVKDFGYYEGRKCYEYFHDRDELCPWCKNEDVWAGKTVRWEWYSSKNERTYDLMDTPMTLPDGSIGKLEIFRDITDRKRMEEEIKSNEARFRELFNNMSSGVAIYEAKDNGNDFIFKDFNRAGEQIEKIKKENLIDKSVLEIFPGVKEFGLFDAFKRVWKTGKPEHHPISIYKDDRIMGWRENFVCKLPSGEIVTVYDDVTERKKAEAELLFKGQIFEQSITANSTSDSDGILTHVNNAFIRNWGYENQEEAVGKPISEFLKFEDEAKKIITALNEAGKWKGEYTALKKDGTTFVAYGLATIIKEESGNVVGYQSAALDISEQKLAEDALRENEEKYRSMMNAMKDPVYICASDYIVEYMNPAMIRSLNRDATGEKCFKAIHDLDEICPWCMHGKISGNECFVHDIVSPRNNRHYQITASAIVHKDGSLSKMTVFRDTTDLIKMEEQESRAEAAALTRQLLAFSRKQVIKPEVLDLNEVINETEKMLKRMIGEDIEFQTILKPELWKVHMDSGQINQIIVNMAVNARDAMPQGGKLIVETTNVDLDKDYLSKHVIEGTPGHYVMLAISDTGSGMDKEIQERIFEPFFTTKEIGKGTGLGLSTVYGIVKQNKGFIWVYSEPGQGTTFKIYLPKVKGDAEGEEKERAPVGDLNGSETVLVVEDDDKLRNLARKVLERYGYSVLEAENGGKEKID